MRLVLMGPPGAGKGTQAEVIARRLGVPAISTGNIFRANVSEETSLGLEAKRYIDAGDYVPDQVTNAMVRDRIAAADAKDGFLLDGYPRTVAQVEELDRMLNESAHAIDAVVVLTVDDDELVERLMHRAGVEGRSDDSEKVIRRRQALYNEQTAPLLAVYAGRGRLVEVDGTGEVDEVTSRVMAGLDDLRGQTAS